MIENVYAIMYGIGAERLGKWMDEVTTINVGNKIIAVQDITAQDIYGEGGDKVIIKAGTEATVLRVWGSPKFPLADVQVGGQTLTLDPNWFVKAPPTLIVEGTVTGHYEPE